MESTVVEAPPKEDEVGVRRSWQGDSGKKTSSGLQNHLDLRLGMSLNTVPEGMFTTTTSTCEAKGSVVGPSPRFSTTSLEGLLLQQSSSSTPAWINRWFQESGDNALTFAHPWSLAARQQKAFFEKVHQKPPTASPTVSRSILPPSPPVVGWPPIRASRRNLVSLQVAKPEMDGRKATKRPRTTNKNDKSKNVDTKTTMFVKVNMEGHTIGRKIDLKAHGSYQSLSRMLQKMFNNFLSASYCNNFDQDEECTTHSTEFNLIYEDHEGDKMLVGDVPWEMFISSVKRLYIANSSNTTMKSDGRVAEDRVIPS